MIARICIHASFAALLGAIFYFGGYLPLSSRESSSWHYEYVKSTITAHTDADTLILGDSTAGNDFRTNYYNSHSKHKAVTLAMPGSWYFAQHKLAAFARSQNRKITTVILLLGPDTFRSNVLKGDIKYCRNSLTLLDIYKTWLYCPDRLSSAKSTAEIIFRPFLFQSDLQDFFSHIADRVTMAPENYRILHRTVSASDQFYEEESDFDVCDIGDLEKINERIESYRVAGNKEQETAYERILNSYRVRKSNKAIAEGVPSALNNFIQSLSGKFDKVYVINSPVFSGFDHVYPRPYLNAIEDLTRRTISHYPNVEYIPLERDISNDCHNFLDVVHMNASGGEKVTKVVLTRTDNDFKSPTTVASAPPIRKTLMLRDFGPDPIHAGMPFNVQPNGVSAVWAACENASASSIIVINEKKLKSVSHIGGKLVTAEVPADLTKKKGNYTIYLLDPKTNIKSKSMILSVE